MKLKMRKKEHNIDWVMVGYVVLIIAMLVLPIISMVSYMSLNNWDLRCAFVECKPVKVIGDENEQSN